MVKDILKGFAYALGRIIAFILIGLLITFLISKIDTKKIPLNQLIMKSMFVNAYAQTNISPSSKNFYWSAQNNDTGQIDTANFNYSSGWFVVGVARNQFTLLRQGSIINYQNQAGNYSAVITYAWATGSIQYTQAPQYCDIWASDLNNKSCSVLATRKDTATIEGYTRDVIYTTVQYNWNSSTGYVELYLDYTGTVFQPYATYFKYTIDNFYFNPDNSGIIVDQNNTIINQNNEINNSINNVSNTINSIFGDTEISGDSVASDFADIDSISDTPVSDLITLPLVLIRQLYNSMNSSCSSYTLPFGFGLTDFSLTFPCVDLGHEKYFGRVVWGYIDDLMCIFMILNIFKMVVWFWSHWTSLKDSFEWFYDPSTKGVIL